jgi:outer membrane protein
LTRDSLALANARIAYFHMDSVQTRFELIKEKDARFKKEGQRLESNLQNEMAKAQARYEELMKKDQSYSTQAEVRQDEAELQGLMGKIQQMQQRSEQQLMVLEAEMLNEITAELKGFLEEYNKQAGFDYIFSIQNGGQIWVGNQGLNVTDDMVQGLNARHRARKTTGQ